ncbi:phospholipase D/nuclease [Aspergillus homomorphus CBS 101889]|uniref:phospholipase D n=1 Tax=Aspergillus homomorphus (strain CBS 101889) TaxID=1450537 RepID=A0A395HRH6_ASPHC|nr:phospholipase D/nuclease [Aspergillus homomorphus CBS 101889]RAL10176.1 phospholipase D/nuclease [Aspergillus homomorphus CBS 101889]
MPSFLDRATAAAKNLSTASIQSPVSLDDVTKRLGISNISETVSAWRGTDEQENQTRYSSSSPISDGNNVKFHVDGCAYFWAVSEALLTVKESVWILGWWVSPEVYLRRPPSENEQYRLDRMLLAAAERGVKVNVVVFKEVPQVMYLSSKHTKRALEALHPNISVFRYPDLIQGAQGVISSTKGLLQSITASGVSGLGKISDETLQTMFGIAGGPTLLWAHHEKLVICDQKIAFLGGIDLSYGRWDTIQHPIADAHPGNLDDIVFPGQDYNNARVMDFKNLDRWEHNKLSRLTTSRMGWQDISVSLTGPAVAEISRHFVERWNFIHNLKYNARLPGFRTYEALPPAKPSATPSELPKGSVSCQLVRSVNRWSDGISTENSIYNAYIDIIEKSEHFVYLEQQFFITSTGTWLGTVWNRVGEALVARILRAAREGKRYKVIVVMPAVPAFPGDLQALVSGHPPRAIMKLQYKSINRGGFSIMDKIKRAGVNPEEYIRFYNLRSYDRINESGVLQQATEASHVDYNAASQEHDDMVDPFGLRAQNEIGEFEATEITADHKAYRDYQKASTGHSSDWDTVSSCYMLGGEDIRNVPWPAGGSVPEIDAFVSEELYVHSKVLIADDRVVVCGSANLNDRSLKGSRDSEIALVIEDQTSLDTTMNNQLYQASRFAATLRRYLFRKHLGLLRPQDMRKPDSHFLPAPVPIDYDYGSAEDQLVADPLSDEFLELWNGLANANTLAFRKVFAPMPDDTAKTWFQYQTLFWKRYLGPDGLHMAKWGHVQKSNFSSGEEGAKEVKEELSKIRGTLVEMPLEFLINTDIQIEDPGYNIITRQGYV